MTNEKLYEERLNRFMTATDHIEPDRVPVQTMISNWSMAYGGATYKECINNYEWYVKEIDTKIYRQMNADIAMSIGLLQDMRPGEILGYQNMFISEDGISIQHKEGRTMPYEDYPKLIADPLGYFAAEFIPKTYKDITIGKITESVKYKMDSFAETAWVGEYVKKEFGLPVIIAGGPLVSPPFDFLFDQIRGFKGTLTDIRRNPQMVLDAVEALYPIAEKNLNIKPNEKKSAYPFAMTMFHAPTYLSYKDFMKFYAPTLDRLLDIMFDAGQKFYVFLEGTWKHLYPWLNSLRKNMVIGIVEKDDIFEIKKEVGDNITLVGGMPLNVLRYENKQYCIDYAKKVVDSCAPGGGYVFCADKSLICPGDVNAENYIAVHNFVYDYGKR